MRAWENPQGPIGFVRVVKVESEGEHLLEKLDGRLDVRNTVLRAPRPEAGNVSAGSKR